MQKKKKGKTLEKKLKAYSAAAAGALLLAPSAHAAVQYSGLQNLVVTTGNPALVNMNGDAVNDFNFFRASFLVMSSLTSAGMGGMGHINSYPGIGAPDPANLSYGFTIGSTLTGTLYWAGGTDTLAGPPTPLGNFYTQGSQGYIGVVFDDFQCEHYGWIQFRHDNVGPPFTQGTVIDWAYEDACGVSILAGDVGPPPVPAPTLNQWGLLILMTLLAGAGTLMIKKQQENS